jgi:hypothetical protein
MNLLARFFSVRPVSRVLTAYQAVEHVAYSDVDTLSRIVDIAGSRQVEIEDLTQVYFYQTAFCLIT